MIVIFCANIIEVIVQLVSTGMMLMIIVMIVILLLANGRTDMSTETVIIFICGMFAGVLMEFIISAVVIMKGEK